MCQGPAVCFECLGAVQSATSNASRAGWCESERLESRSATEAVSAMVSQPRRLATLIDVVVIVRGPLVKKEYELHLISVFGS